MFKRLLELLERIAIALETIAKIEYAPKSIDNTIEIVDPPDHDVEDEEISAQREEALKLISDNPSKQLWPEDNLSSEQLEFLE